MESAQSKRVSFILPTRNRAEYLDKVLMNVKEYLTNDDELIIIDGSTNDETERLISKKYRQKNIIYIHSLGDRNEGHATNIGLLVAKGEFIKPISDDDFMYPDAMKDAIRILQKDKSLDALQCGGEAYRFNTLTDTYEKLFIEKVPTQITIGSDYSRLMSYAPCHLGLIFKRRLLPLVGLYDTTFTATDVNMFARMIVLGINFRYLDVCLYKHIQYDHSTERQAERISRDMARAFLYTGLLDEALAIETKYLTSSLGIPVTSGNMGFIWWIKLNNYFRRTMFGKVYFSLLGFFIEIGRNIYMMLSRSSSSSLSLPSKVKWTKKYW